MALVATSVVQRSYTAAAAIAGGAGARPATPLGYAVVLVNGIERKVAYY